MASSLAGSRPRRALGMGNIAVIGNAWLRAALRRALAGQLPARFVRDVEGTQRAAEHVSISHATLRGGPRTFFEFESENWEGPSSARVEFLRANDVQDAVIAFFGSAGPRREELTAMRRAGVRRIIGVVAEEAGAPAGDSRNAPTAEQSFFTIAKWLSYPTEQATVVRLASGWPSKEAHALDEFARNALDFVDTELGRHAVELKAPTGVRFACATCGIVLTEAVEEISFERAESEWNGKGGHRDESLSPPLHFFRYTGKETEATYWLRNNLLYFNSVDWLNTTDNGQGMKTTCCGARPEGNALNLSCPNGHELGTVWLDCCAPQGVHVIESRVSVLND